MEHRGVFAKYAYIYILAAESLFQIENLKSKLARHGEKIIQQLPWLK